MARQHEFAGAAQLRRRRPGVAAQGLPELRQRFTRGGRVQQRADLVHEVIAGGAVGGPARVDALVIGQDLFHDQIGFGGQASPRARRRRLGQRRAQPAQVGARRGQAVDVVDTQPVEQAFAVQAQGQGVHGVEYDVVLDPHANQLVDFEEAPPVDLVGRGAPPGQAVMLAFQQLVQAAPAGHRVRRMRGARARGALHRQGRFGQGIALAAHHDGVTLGAVVRQDDGAGIQAFAVRIGQHRQQYLAAQGGVGGAPVDVEAARMRAAFAVAQHVGPPGVGDVGGHVVGHDVGDQSHAVGAGLVRQAPKGGLAAQFRADLAMVDDIVAVGGAGARA